MEEKDTKRSDYGSLLTVPRVNHPRFDQLGYKIQSTHTMLIWDSFTYLIFIFTRQNSVDDNGVCFYRDIHESTSRFIGYCIIMSSSSTYNHSDADDQIKRTTLNKTTYHTGYLKCTRHSEIPYDLKSIFRKKFLILFYNLLNKSIVEFRSHNSYRKIPRYMIKFSKLVLMIWHNICYK